ncbi:MAG: PEP/pyruvate-binding domain-containing protein, partial [bacterium]|nr:PEP/pyruvate-binding domain-containing protein [bacterium]
MSTKETIFIKNFSKITKKSVFEAGGKGASLGEMTNSKIPVPPGFVLLAGAFDRFLAETDLTQELEAQLKKVNYKDINSVDRYSNVIRDLIAKAKMPVDLQKDIVSEFKKLKVKFVAVRSSATAEDSSSASWAGELETYLNTTEKTLLFNVKKCWSSLFTPRAIFYRHEKKLLKAKVSVAVVVQEMVDSEISGIAFTVHPVTKDKNQMIIEAGYGLGEAIVSGSVTPDSYVLDKRDYSLIDINVATQEKQIIKGAGGGTKWTPVAKSAR